jgi:hypothetical protein
VFVKHALGYRKIPVRPELVEGFRVNGWWFDKLTTNGLVNSISFAPALRGII